MSGIVGILQLDGAPVDRNLLCQITDSLAFRGPDAQQTWLDGCVGFGHALLKTTEESEREHQPFTLDGQTWIVADARIDAQRDLIADLQGRGSQALAGQADVELILRAYQAWGEDCVEHLLGDFAFAVWDAPRQRLFCARDHMGVKPFFYAQVGSIVIFSNSLDCIRLHPHVSRRLSDQAVADFLLFEWNMDPATTIFADISRLPPAHRATWSRSGSKLSRYWTLPVEEPILYKRAGDYVDRFKELCRAAVGDRLRTNRLAICMSGGLDSSTLAAISRDLLAERYRTLDLRAITEISDIAPEERQYAGWIADHLGIPIHFHKCDEKSVDPNWERIPFRTPQPTANAWQGLSGDEHWRELASYSRVFFWGEGPDNALYFELRSYLRYLLRQHRYGRLLRDSFSTAFAQRRPPFWGLISRRLSQFRTEPEATPVYPDWLNPEFEARLRLRDRWRDLRVTGSSSHPIHPRSYASLQTPLWPALFEALSPDWTKASIEFRHPYVDLRVLRFFLTVPVLPWCRAKYLLRRAMRGALPREVLQRPKIGLSPRKTAQWISRPGLVAFSPVKELFSYVNPSRVPDSPDPNECLLYEHLRIRSLNHWLQHSLTASIIPGDAKLRDDQFVTGSARKTAREEAL